MLMMRAALALNHPRAPPHARSGMADIMFRSMIDWILAAAMASSCPAILDQATDDRVADPVD